MKPVPPPADPQRMEQAYQAFFHEDLLPYLDGSLARDFFADLAEQTPDQRSLLLGRILPALAGPLPLERKQRIIEQTAAAALAAGRVDVFHRHDRRVLDHDLAGFIASVNTVGDGRTVVFVTTNPYFVILREAMYLRRHGWRVFLVCLATLPETLRTLFAANFDGIAFARRSFRFMRALLAALRPDVFHVQCWMWMYVLGRITLEARGSAKVVCEFYDITSTYAERAVLCQGFKPDIVDFDFTLEKYILTHADAVITRFPRFAIDEWGRRHGAMPPHLEMQAWPCAEFAGAPRSDKPSRQDGRIRLVYAGALVLVDEDRPPILFPEAGMPDGFRILLQQGIAIDVLHGPYGSDGEDGGPLARYHALQHEFEHFRILPGVPPDRLSAVLSEYDFGILLFDWHPDARIRDSQRRGVMATKLYGYVEAGIPGLVNAEYEAMAGFLESNGVGLGIASRDLPRLREILAGYDYGQAQANIRRFQAEQSMANHIGGLIDLYETLLSET